MANTLARLTAVRTMLARARTLEDVKKIHDMAEAALTRNQSRAFGPGSAVSSCRSGLARGPTRRARFSRTCLARSRK